MVTDTTRWPQALLLDFYGTVVEENDWLIERICAEIAASSPVTSSPSEVGAYWRQVFDALCKKSWGKSFRQQKEIERLSLARVLQRFGSDLDANAISPLLADSCAQARLFPESRAVLAQCGLPICVVSNIDNAELEAALDATGLHFDQVVTSEDCRAYKPRPEMFQQALAMLDLRAEQALFVGDSLSHDVRGAKSLGIPVLWLNRDRRPMPHEYDTPNHVADDLWGVLKLLQSGLPAKVTTKLEENR